MAKWAGWVAAVGGVLAGLPSVKVGVGQETWLIPLGAIVAIVFGIWAAYQ